MCKIVGSTLKIEEHNIEEFKKLEISTKRSTDFNHLTRYENTFSVVFEINNIKINESWNLDVLSEI